MNISPISYNSRVSMKADNQQPAQKKNEGKIYPFRYSPVAVGVLNGVTWFGIGLAFDKVLQAFSKTKHPFKTSAIVNGAVGLVMGTYTFIKARNMQKTQNVNSWDDFQKQKSAKS